MEPQLSRRAWLAQAPAVLGAGALASRTEAAKDAAHAEPFGYCLNTSTISGQKLDLVEITEIAAKAGYQALEPWIHELDRHVKARGSLKELGKRIKDKGLTVESAIGFPEWVVDDDGRRKNGLEEVKRCMDLVQQLGGKRLAMPPAGATKDDISLSKVTERYRAVLDVSDKLGVVPQIEFWGPSRTLSRLSEAAFVAIESGHAQACILADVYHLYKGGSNVNGLRLLSGIALHVLHFNDYPANPARGDITDAQRVYPGDGVAPLKNLLRELRDTGFRGFLSLELFNRDYWKQDAATVARTGLDKMRAVVKSSLA